MKYSYPPSEKAHVGLERYSLLTETNTPLILFRFLLGELFYVGRDSYTLTWVHSERTTSNHLLAKILQKNNHNIEKSTVESILQLYHL
jgi:hypothetical protein